MPVARQRARAPAILRPWVEVRERYIGIAGLPIYLIRNEDNPIRLTEALTRMAPPALLPSNYLGSSQNPSADDNRMLATQAGIQLALLDLQIEVANGPALPRV